jgi:hypothetical protein
VVHGGQAVEEPHRPGAAPSRSCFQEEVRQRGDGRRPVARRGVPVWRGGGGSDLTEGGSAQFYSKAQAPVRNRHDPGPARPVGRKEEELDVETSRKSAAVAALWALLGGRGPVEVSVRLCEDALRVWWILRERPCRFTRSGIGELPRSGNGPAWFGLGVGTRCERESWCLTACTGIGPDHVAPVVGWVPVE